MASETEQEKTKHRLHKWVPVFLILFLTLPFLIGNFVQREIFFNESNVNVEEGFSLPADDGTLKGSAAFIEQNIPHTPLPSEVRGIYWTAYTAGTARGKELLAYMLESGLNTAVIDLKMDNGQLAFTPNDVSMEDYVMRNPTLDPLEDMLDWLYENDIYRIARIPVMRDGAFASAHPNLAMQTANGNLWQDNIGSLWMDPAASEVTEYAIALAKEAYERGFDEVQFDYVRFASDGAIRRIVYPVYNGVESKVDVMQRFFKNVGGAMKEAQVPSSFDLFGMTYWSHSDFNIGQRLVDVFNYTDWTSAMVYPSHYPDGFRGFANPAENPYWIVKASMDEGVKRMLGIYAGTEEELRATFRPWLQDFDIGAIYTADLIEAQIKAARDAGASGWILWNARNVYEPANYE